MAIKRQEFFDETRGQTLAAVSLLLDQLKAGWPAGETISSMVMSNYLIGLRIGLETALADPAKAKMLVEWMDGSIRASTESVLGSITTEGLDSIRDKTERLLQLVKDV